jgi:O-antigen ligase
MQATKKLGRLEKVFLGGLFLTVLTVTPYWVMDPMNLPKMTIVGILGFTLLGTSINAHFLDRAREQKVLMVLAGAFIFNGLLVLFLSGRTINEGLFGVSGRNTGFLTYFGFTMVLLVAAQLSSAQFIKSFIYVFTAIGVILSIYGLIQHLGLEPFPYVNIYESNVFGTFGNPNFQSAFMGIFSALLFGLALNESDSLQKRLLMGSLALVGVYGVFITNSWQGFFNFTAGAGVAIVLNLFRRNKEKLGLIILGIGSALAILVALGLFNQGPLASALAKASLSARRIYWEAAVRMLLDNPLFGVGWDGFGDWFRRSRSADAVKFNPGLVSDSAHSVPLDIASGGGISLLSLYLSFILLGILAVVKVVKSKRELSVNYIALVAAWGSYQAQSMISINQIGLGVIGWGLTGLIIGYAYIEKPASKINNERASKLIARKQTQNFSFISFFAPLVGLIIGCLVSLPPYISASKFYEGMKTSDARVINVNAYLEPLDSRRMLYAASVLERNKFYKEAHEIATMATQNFSDSFEVWSFLLSLTNSTDEDKAKARAEMKRLDPLNPSLN